MGLTFFDKARELTEELEKHRRKVFIKQQNWWQTAL